MKHRTTLLPFDPRCRRAIASNGVQIAAIADGETCVRYWSPHLIYGTLAAALKRTDDRFPCVHKVTPVDPTTSQPVGPARWSVACRKIDWARYAIDYALDDKTRRQQGMMAVLGAGYGMAPVEKSADPYSALAARIFTTPTKD